MNEEQIKLLKYLNQLNQLKKIQSEIRAIQERLDLLDWASDDAGAGNDLLESADTNYWLTLKKEQIDLELSHNAIERETLLFEKGVLEK